MAKKPAPKKDWTREYIKYRLRSEYGSMVAFAIQKGLNPDVIKRALHVPYPKVERVIASALGATPVEIWPSRYDPELLRSNWRLWRRLVNVQSSTAAKPALVETDQTN
ncbi:helix-turn-helix domain-containing protein [Accumulibacter sp.]|uniref:helix-turn-helix domain-containing protein n=1 Tax=Accumulibacter sp. TaxID=2053492 RepID=UPI002605280C|nr:helix-turn-helix domain-containing protein [Accumulibacter sp.]